MYKRQVEELARSMKESSAAKSKPKTEKLSQSVLEFQDNLSFHLKTKVKVTQGTDGKGKITIDFKDQAHLDKILGLLDN